MKTDPVIVVERHFALNWITWFTDKWNDKKVNLL